MEQATNVAVPPTFLFSLVGFLVMLRKVGFAGCGAGTGVGIGAGTGVMFGAGVTAGDGAAAGSSRAAGLGTGMNSVGAFAPVNTA